MYILLSVFIMTSIKKIAYFKWNGFIGRFNFNQVVFPRPTISVGLKNNKLGVEAKAKKKNKSYYEEDLYLCRYLHNVI